MLFQYGLLSYILYSLLERDKMKAWFLLHCKAKQEKRAQEHVQNQGYQTYLPCMQARSKKRTSTQGNQTQQAPTTIHVEPMFPNYLFIYLDTQTANFNALRSTRGVNGFVRFGGLPAVVPDTLIASLEQLSHELCAPTSQQDVLSSFAKGQAVEVIDGPFAGQKAIFDAMGLTQATGEERCFILLNILGQEQRIEMNETSLLAV